MEPEVIKKWMEEIRLHCRFAGFAWQHMRASLTKMDNEETFFYLEAFLHHAATVGNLLAPAHANDRQRGQSLAKELKHPAESPLCQSEFRNGVLHFDHAFGTWMESVGTNRFLHLNVMPKGTMSGAREDLFVRSLDPETYELELLGVSFNLRELHTELDKLNQAAERWMQHH